MCYSGGVNHLVTGENLHAIQEPKIFVRLEGREFYGACTVLSDTRMTCMSPSISATGYKINPDKPIPVPFGFIMDDVVHLRNLSVLGNKQQFHFFPDPEFDKFENDVKYFQPKNEYLTINVSVGYSR